MSLNCAKLRYGTRDFHFFFLQKLSNFSVLGRAKMIHVFRIETNKKEMLLHLLLSSQVEIQLTK